MGAEDITNRPTLSLVREDDHEPFELTRGDWRGLWIRFDQLHFAQQDLGAQMGEVRSTVRGVRDDMSKVLLAVTPAAAPELPEPVPPSRFAIDWPAVTRIVLLLCAVTVTGRHMGWW
jgi:hypothetical protein